MSDTRAAEGGFDFIRGRSEHTIISNIDRIYTALLPETVSSNDTVQWLRSLQGRADRNARDPDSYEEDSFRHLSGGRAFIGRILEPVVQARLDFLTQSLYPVARIISVSDRAIEIIASSREPAHIAMTLDTLRDDQHADAIELRDAVSGSLADLLTVARDVHQRRRAAALQVFEEWLTETKTFRSVFEPARRALGDTVRDRRAGLDDVLVRSLAPLLAYLSRYPRLGSALQPDDALAVREGPLVLSPSEMFGLLMAMQALSADEEGWSFRRYEYSVHEFTLAFRELANEPLIQAELARLQERIANFDPFSDELLALPTESLRAEMRDHVLSNGAQSPWLRQFLNRFGEEPRWWSDPIQAGSAQDPAYVEALARSARSTIVHNLISDAPHLGEPWDQFLERLFTEKWLRRLRKAISRSGDPLWTRDKFTAVVDAVCKQLRRDGYRLSIDDRGLGDIWDSALDE